MDSFLIREWRPDDPAAALPMLDAASVSVARERVRTEAARLGLPVETTAKLVNVASELANNQLAHARSGWISIGEIRRGGVAGLEVCAVDEGRGIDDPARALGGGASTAGTLGVGLAAVLELAREVDFDVRRGEGTCIRARVFASDVPRLREVGVFSRPYPGEPVSGDGALFCRSDDRLVLAVADGLGHGEEARAATTAVLEAARSAMGQGPQAMLAAGHAAAAGTRGAAMTVAVIDGQGRLSLAGVGNVMACIVGPRKSSRFTGSPGVVGAPGPLRRIGFEETPLSPYDAVVLFTDGLSSR
ncbi:MAG TPA: SpoIIE family protein phosphatase, partial [Polyangiaceae bacterium]